MHRKGPPHNEFKYRLLFVARLKYSTSLPCSFFIQKGETYITHVQTQLFNSHIFRLKRIILFLLNRPFNSVFMYLRERRACSLYSSLAYTFTWAQIEKDREVNTWCKFPRQIEHSFHSVVRRLYVASASTIGLFTVIAKRLQLNHFTINIKSKSQYDWTSW